MKFQIADALVDFETNRLERADGAVELEPRVADVLHYLVKHAGHVVSREDLLAHVWNTQHVSDDVITRCVNLIRRSFADDARNPRVLQTITKRGYRLIADVRQLDGDPVAKRPDIIRTHAEIDLVTISAAAFLLGAVSHQPAIEDFLAADMNAEPTGTANESAWRGGSVRITVRAVGEDLIVRVRRRVMTVFLPVGGGVLGFVLSALSVLGTGSSISHALAVTLSAAILGALLGLIYKSRFDQKTADRLTHRRDTLIAAALRE